MIKKNKIYKTTAMALAVISLFGSSSTYSSAYESLNTPQAVSQFADGEYELNTTLKHESKDEASIANTYLKSSKIDIKNGKMYMNLVFKNGGMIKEVTPNVDGNIIVDEETLNGDEKTIVFEIPSIDSNIMLNVKINPFGDMIVNANCIIKTEFVNAPSVKPENPEQPPIENPDKEEIPEVEEPPIVDEDKDETPEIKPENPENVAPPTEDIDKEESTKPDNSQSEYKNGFYKLKNIVKIDNSTGYAMVRNLLNESTVMEVKDNKTYITFEMSGYSMMKNIQLKVDGHVINHTQTDLGNDNVRIKLEVGSVNSNITMKAFINAMGKDVEFGIGLDKSTISFVSSNEEPTIPSNPTNNNNSNSTNNESDGSNGSTNDVVENATVKGKLYTIKNEIIEDNATGKEMARKYLNSTTKIEESNGKMYATLTFTGVDLMKDHKIYVNGSKVSHQVVSKSTDSISIRFEIPNVDADIKVELHVIPMGSNIDFGVKLLKDTLTFVKEYDAGSNGLPQTGSLINSNIMMGTGSLLAASSLLLGRKKRK